MISFLSIDLIAFLKVIIPRIKNKPPNQQDLEKWQKKWEEATDGLENVWLKRSSYLAANHITIADLLGK
jgi:hypothetical protein